MQIICMEANEYDFCVFYHQWNQLVVSNNAEIPRVYHSDGGRTDPFSIGAYWTKTTASSSWDK